MMISKSHDLISSYLLDNDIDFCKMLETDDCYITLPKRMDNAEMFCCPLHIVQNANMVIDKTIEITLRFYKNYVEITSFFSRIFAKPKNYGKILEIINFCNHNQNYYYPEQHKIALQEDTGDICNISTVRHESVLDNLDGIMDFILECQREILEEICYPLFLAMEDKMDEAKEILKNNQRKRK